MSHSHPVPTLVAAAVFLAACGTSPRPKAPTPAAAPARAAAPAAAAPAAPAAAAATLNLAGDWDVRLISARGDDLASTLRLVPRGETYAGMMQAIQDGGRPLYVRGVTVTGNRVMIQLELEGEEARVDAVLRGAHQMEGSFTSRPVQGRITLRRR